MTPNKLHMPDQITVQPKTESHSPSPASEQPNVNLGPAQLISFCAGGLLISFFLPWVGYIGQSVSGFDLQKMPGHQKWLWIIPVFSAITLFAPLLGRYQKIAARLTGVLPFCVLAYWLNQLGSELLRILGLGAWLSLILGLALLILPQRLK